MIRWHRNPWPTGLFLVLTGMFSGCGPATPPVAQTPPPPVTVSQPLAREVTDYEDFTGRTEAVESVEVRARVWGYLAKINFKDGTEVKKDDVLFEIDPRPYQADLDQAAARVHVAEAQVKFAEAEYKRNIKLRSSGAVSAEDVEKSLAQRDSAKASLASGQADVAQKKLDLDFTKVIAPISGRASRTQITEGNLIQAGATGSTLLTTLVSMDPMYAYFDVDERTVLRIQKLIREGKLPSTQVKDAKVPVLLGLANEEGHPHQGIIDFVDNKVDPSTGTIRVRGVFDNKERILTAGLFVRIRLPIGNPHQALLVTERALGTDQGQKFLYTINDKNEVVFRPVNLGALHDGLRVIAEGLKQGERVIVNGLQRVRPGATVDPKVVDMPTQPVSRQGDKETRRQGDKKEM
ncbi:MAG: efflux RND transporter periplasmic adaptor subunit [Gemmataceae bacterium]|nr:efflux RND transporter periplasmic adaptor subunit [Gemmataceae bacterium]